ncbi:MAG: hypothetical protein JNG86_23540, partial [Verrucomicrobiaceae bacterium]|nr:hypothetical protein [Verrucomicrobiaceae bacterium]
MKKTHKVGDIVNDEGFEMQVMAVSKSKGGFFTSYKMSAEPIAKRKGYITNNQILGARIEHFPPPFVPHGARRDPATLKKSDWNFVELMKRPLAEKKVALFHELARESARVRLACARLEAGAAIESEWQNKKAAAYQKERQAREAAKAIKARLANAKSIKARAALKAKLTKANEVVRLAKCESSYVAVTSGNGQERVDFAEALRFLERLEKRFPYGVGEV